MTTLNYLDSSSLPECLTCDFASNGSCYEYFSELKTWYNANSSCHSLGGQLISAVDTHILSLIHNSTNTWVNLTPNNQICGYFSQNGSILNGNCSEKFNYACRRSGLLIRIIIIIIIISKSSTRNDWSSTILIDFIL